MTAFIVLLAIVSPKDFPHDLTPVPVRVTDVAGKPIEGVSVYSSIWTKVKMPPNNDYPTTADGVAKVMRPAQVQILRLWISKPGFATLFRSIETGVDGGNADIPSTFDVQLLKGKVIRGRVVDERGKPIVGARVEANATLGRETARADGFEYSGTLSFGSDAPKTDADGYWQLDNVPATAIGVNVRLIHPDYVSEVRIDRKQKPREVSFKELQAGTAIITMQDGAKLTGTITDPDGKPVPKAVVVFHDEPYENPKQEVLTDENGRYTLPTLPVGEFNLTIMAKGWMPVLRPMNLVAGPRTENVQLEPAKQLRFKLVDPDGKPVPAAYVRVQSWRGKSTIYNDRHPNVINSQIPYRTDKEGVFDWTWAPADAVKFSIGAKGFHSRELELIATRKEQTIILTRPHAIAGNVTDAETGKPIESFKLIRVLEFALNNLSVERRDPVSGSGGKYAITLDREDTDYQIMIEATGYKTAVSRTSLVKSKTTEVNFKLEPAEALQGQVLGIDGKPLAAATVMLANTVQAIRLSVSSEYNQSTKTNNAGEFFFPAQFGRYTLLVRHTTGAALVERATGERGGTITLKPWASIRGRVWQDGKPVPGQYVSQNPVVNKDPDAPTVRFESSITIGEDGSFYFPQVMPGPNTLSTFLGPWEPSPLTSSETAIIDVKPGESVLYDLGKQGATLVGQLKFQGNVPQGLNWTYSINHLVRKSPAMPIPAGWNPLKLDLQKEWDIQRMDSAEAKAFRNFHHSFFVKPQPDGRFRICGVPPGDYWLELSVFEKPEGCLVNPVGIKIVSVTVKAKSDEMVLDPITVEVEPELKLGQPLPKATLRDASGKPIDLSTYRGKYILMHGWAGWCVSCAKSYGPLRKLRAEYPAEQLVMIGLNLDAEPETMTKLATKHQFDWPQVQLQPDSQTAKLWHLHSIPMYYVIAPDGTLAFHGSYFPGLEELLAKQLKK